MRQAKQEIKVDDYQEVDENVLTDICKKHDASIVDWIEKDYYIVVIIHVSPEKLSELIEEINSTHGYDVRD